ncbi:hypothetical protein [Gallaecimonas sp. GXIMD4217]|uniref:hypothetical protein n=1 Tax=Gallaecimonas sp. GXIMD4217 TaxID=3131927 RepID=UPI00311AC523
MKKIFCLLTLLVLCLPARAQFDGLAPAVDRLKAATLNGQVRELVALMHPRAIRNQGGEEAALVKAERSLAVMKAQGLELVSFEVDKPAQFYPAKDDWVAFLPTVTRYKGSDREVTSSSYLVAARPKAGGDWRFVDGAGVELPQQLYNFFPGLVEGIEIPEKHSKIRVISPWTPKQP